MKQSHKRFPEFLFPKPAPEHTEKRQLFADFGSVSGVNIYHRNETLHGCCQRIRHSDHWSRLCARKPTLPLIKCNECILDEPCMADIDAKRKQMILVCKMFRHRKGIMKFRKRGPAVRKIVNELARAYPNTFDQVYDLDDPDGPNDEFSEEAGNPIQSEIPGVEDLCAPIEKVNNYLHLNLAKVLLEEPALFEKDALDLSVNNKYTGGCLSCQKLSDDQGVVFFTKGPQMDHLCSLPMHIGNHQLSALESEAHISYHHQQIYQVDSVFLHQEVYVASRTEESCSLFRLHSNGQDDDSSEHSNLANNGSVDTKLLDICSCPKEQLTSISLSPFIPGELVMTCQDGDFGLIKLWSPGFEPEVILKNHEPRFPVKQNWTHAYYSSHPRHISVADYTGVSLYDMRTSPRISSDLMTLTGCGLHKNERVMMAIRHPKQDFYHLVATDYSVILLDERFPNHQIIQWHHPLLSHPQYLSVVTNAHLDTGEDLLLVGSQAIPETLAYPLSMKVGSLDPPCGAGACWRVSRIDDFIHLAHKQGYLSSGVLTDTPLIGIGALGHANGEGGVSILQLSSMGNLFYQDYTFTSSYCEDKTKSFGPGGQDVCLSKDEDLYITDWLADCESYLTKTARHSWFSTDLTRIIQETIKDQVAPNVVCSACPKLDADQTTASATVDELAICYNCRIRLTESSHIRECSLKNRICPKLSSHCSELPHHIQQFNLGSPEKYDYTSQILVKLWQNEDISELVKKRDEELLQSRQERFEKWKEEKKKKEEEPEENVYEMNESDKEMSSKESCSHAGSETPETRAEHASLMPSPSLPRKRKTSISSTSSRASLHGFASTPVHIQRKSKQPAGHSPRTEGKLMSQPDHGGTDDGSSVGSSPNQGSFPNVSFVFPSSRKLAKDSPANSPVRLFSPELLRKKSKRLVMEGSHPEKGKLKKQIPGFL